MKEIRLAKRLTLDAVASELQVSKQAVSKYERGISLPSSQISERIIEFYGITNSYLTKDSISGELFQSPLFFRTKKSTKIVEKEMASIYIKWVYEIMNESNIDRFVQEVNLPKFSDSLSIAQKAMELRKEWNMGLGPINNLVEIIEANGINVVSIDTSKISCDAYSQFIGNVPIIIINKNIGSAVRWRFNLAHELGHLVLHSKLNPNILESNDEYNRIESEANEFAENFLLPADSFGKCVMSDKLEYFLALKKEWKVSVAALLYRCGRLDIIQSKRIIQLQRQISVRGWRVDEPLDNEMEYEKSNRFQKIVLEQLYDKSSTDEFLTKLRLPFFSLDNILGLNKEYFEKLGVTLPGYENKMEYQQLTLF